MSINYNLMADVNNGVDIRDMKLRVVDYARVSTASLEQRKSFQNQLETYRQMIDSNPNWTYAGTYSDEGITGTKASLRGGFLDMIADGEAGLFDLVIVKDIARFARNVKDCLVYKDRLKSAGVMIWFVKDNINSFRKSDDMLFHILSLGAEMESRSAHGRTQIVFAQGIQNGKIYGNSKILGYAKDHCRLVIDEDEAKIVRLIFDLYVHQRMGLRRIAKELADRSITRKDGTQISTRTLKTVLENPKYKGYYCGGKTIKLDMGERYVRRDLPPEEWVMYKDPSIPAIVSETLWDEAARIRKERGEKFSEQVSMPCNQGIYRYSGKIESGFALGVNYTRVVYKYNGIEREGWQCRNHKNMKNPSNVGPTLYSDELDKIIQGILREMLGGYDSMVDELMRWYQAATEGTEGKKRLSALEKEEASLAKKRARLLDLYEDGGLTKEEYRERNAEHNTALNAIHAEREALLASAQKERELAIQLSALKNAIRQTAEESVPSRATIDSLIEKIYVRSESSKSNIYLDFILKFNNAKQSFKIVRQPHSGKNLSCNCCNKDSSACTTLRGRRRRRPSG